MSDQATPTVKPPAQFAWTERCYCTQCQAEIPQELIVRQLRKADPYTAPQQRVRAWCEHCKAMFECQRILRNGVWEVENGSWEIVTDEKRRATFLTRIKTQRGVMDAA
jgi:hypothetical protein